MPYTASYKDALFLWIPINCTQHIQTRTHTRNKTHISIQRCHCGVLCSHHRSSFIENHMFFFYSLFFLDIFTCAVCRISLLSFRYAAMFKSHSPTPHIPAILPPPSSAMDTNYYIHAYVSLTLFLSLSLYLALLSVSLFLALAHFLPWLP